MTPPVSYNSILKFNVKEQTLELTREGAGFVVLSLAVGLGAINTGNNLLYLILAMCCSFIAVSGILSEITMKSILIEISGPEEIYAKSPSPLTVRVSNRKKRTPSFSLRITLLPETGSGGLADREIYLFHLPAGGSVEKTIMLTAGKRGRIEVTRCLLSTGFPFGFFIKRKKSRVAWSATVFPAIHAVSLPAPRDGLAGGDRRVERLGDEVVALKEFKPGDTLRAIHWKSSAKTGTLRVKEFSRQGPESFTVHLKLGAPGSGAPVEQEVIEGRVSRAASLIYHLIDRGDEVRLHAGDYQSAFGGGEPHRAALMRYLAFAWPGDDPRAAHRRHHALSAER